MNYNNLLDSHLKYGTTKEDIINVAKKIKIDTIFLLEGVLEDADN